MFNSLFNFVQTKSENFIKNSAFINVIDKLIFASFIAVFILSLGASSDVIGCFAFLAFFLTIIKLLFVKGQKLDCNLFEYFLLAYFMVVIVSLFGSTLFTLSLKGFSKTLIYLGFYLSMVQYLKNNNDKIVWIMLIIAGCVSLEALYGTFQFFLKPDEISGWQDTSKINPEDVINRIYGTLKPFNPNLLAGYFVAGISSILGSVALFFINKKQNYAICASVCSLLALFAIFATGCRGAYLAIFAIFVSLALLSAKFFYKTYKKMYVTVVSSIVGVGTALILSISALRLRVLSIFAMRQDSSNSFRFNVYQSCLEMFSDNWLLGIGVGNQNFREIYGLYMKTGFDALSAYNIFLEVAVESGIFALVTFVAFLGLMLYMSVKFILDTKDMNALVLMSVSTISIIALMVHGLVDTVFFRPQIQVIFWAMVAISTTLFRKNTVSEN